MFQRILVPLDGSEQAEYAIPAVAAIARATRSSVILLHVATEAIDGAWQSMETSLDMSAFLEAKRQEMQNYLAHLSTSEALEGIGVTIKIVEGKVAESILALSQSEQADLIVMCSHGYTGWKRWMLGSIAQNVAHHSSLPVLVLPQGAGVLSHPHLDGVRPVRILVALDGSSLAEAALAPAAVLSNTLSAPLEGELHLVLILSPMQREGKESDERTERRKTQAIQAATNYLQAVQDRMQAGGQAHLKVTISVLIDEDIASALITEAEFGEGIEPSEHFHEYDIVAMATHGREGLERLLQGCVTDRVLGYTRLPLLILRPDREEPRKRKEYAEAASWVGLY